MYACHSCCTSLSITGTLLIQLMCSSLGYRQCTKALLSIAKSHWQGLLRAIAQYYKIKNSTPIKLVVCTFLSEIAKYVCTNNIVRSAFGGIHVIVLSEKHLTHGSSKLILDSFDYLQL